MNGAVVVFLIMYFLPTIVAVCRRAKGDCGVLVINVFLGWTFIGWVVALAWAVSSDKRQKVKSFRLG
jgi:Superinfection immunity protein